MASFHCSVKSGSVGAGGAHAEYIEREEKYKSKKDDDLEQVITDNLPEWAENSRDFFRAADEFERVNGSSYREYEIALPRELTKAQRAELVREFIAQEIGSKHAYTAAIHNPKASIDGGAQPHAHIMFSERTRDGIERSREQYFKRFNAKNPEKGGAQKANKPATPTERKAELVKLRERFAELQNKHLAKAGHQARVTHLSLKAQGIDRQPEPHYGAAVSKAAKLEIKADRDEKYLKLHGRVMTVKPPVLTTTAQPQRQKTPFTVPVFSTYQRPDFGFSAVKQRAVRQQAASERLADDVQPEVVQVKPSLEQVEQRMLQRALERQQEKAAELAKVQDLERVKQAKQERERPQERDSGPSR